MSGGRASPKRKNCLARRLGDRIPFGKSCIYLMAITIL